MKIRNILTLLLLLTFTLTTSAQVKEQAAVDSIFAKWDKPDAPGGALGIIKNGKLIYASGYGMSDLEHDIPNDKTSVYRIASTSKQFTAACILKLVEQEKLSLDNTLDMFYPSFPSYAKKITISHLLHHTSGIRDYLTLSALKGMGDNDHYTDKDIMSWLTSQTSLNFEPGAEHIYSNSGYWLLGQIVNKASGMNMADYAAKEIFKPLGMTHTQFLNDHNTIVKNRAAGYSPNRDGGYRINMTTLDMIGDGGVLTTIEDLHKWDNSFYSSTVLNKKFWRMMTERGVLNNGDTISYASGLSIEPYKGLKTISHGGAFVGYRAEILRFPEEGFTVIILANRADANPSRMAIEVADIFLKDKYVVTKEDKASTAKTDQNTDKKYPMKQLTGLYELQPGMDIDIAIKHDSLHVTQLWNNSSYALVNKQGNTYTLPNAPISFTFSNMENNAAQLLTIVQNGHSMICKRKEKVDLSNIDLDDYAGSYYCEELDVTYTLTHVDSSLNISIKDEEFAKLNVYKKDQFTIYGYKVHFKRTSGAVTGFSMNFGRVKNLAFKKQD